MDLFSFSDDKAEITVNANWLQHLQERLLGDDGHPHKVWPAVGLYPLHHIPWE